MPRFSPPPPIADETWRALLAAAAEFAAHGLMKGLLSAGVLPGKVKIGGTNLQSALAPLCAALQITLQSASSLPSIDEAMDAVTQRFASGMI